MRFGKTLWIVAGLAGGLWAQPVVSDGGVLNGASFARGQAVAAGSLVSIFGSGLAASLLSGDTIPLSTNLNNVSVTFNGVPAGLYFVSDGQINAQVPWNVLPAGSTSGTANVVVTRSGTASVAKQVSIAPFGPGIFSIPPGAGYAIAINADGSLAAPAGAIPGFPTRPAKVGDTIIVLATGLGAVDPQNIANGAASSDVLRRTATLPTVTIGGQAARVDFSGLSPQFPAVNQLNVVIPTLPAGNAVPLQITMGGVQSTAEVTIAVVP